MGTIYGFSLFLKIMPLFPILGGLKLFDGVVTTDDVPTCLNVLGLKVCN